MIVGNRNWNRKEFEKGLRPVLLIGEIFFTFNASLSSRVYVRSRCFSILSILILINLLLEITLLLQYYHQKLYKFGPYQQLDALNTVFLYLAIAAIPLLHQLRGNQLHELLKFVCPYSSSGNPSCKTTRSLRFPRQCVLLTVSMFCLGNTTWIAFQVTTALEVIWNRNSTSIWNAWTQATLPHMKELTNHLPLIPISSHLSKFIAINGWFISDVLFVVFCLAIRENLKSFEENVEGIFLKSSKPKPSTLTNSTYLPWDGLCSEYLQIVNGCYLVEKYAGPLLGITYAEFLIEIVVFLFGWIRPGCTGVCNKGAAQTGRLFLASFGFAQSFVRLFAITYFAADIHYRGNLILKSLIRTPNFVMNLGAVRLQNMMQVNPVGIRLMETFLIKRQTLFTIIGFIATTEILLLQSFGSEKEM